MRSLTWQGLRQGATEQNALAAPFSVTLIGLKATTGATTIYFLERLRKEHPTQAVVATFAVTALMLGIVWHNAEVVRRK